MFHGGKRQIQECCCQHYSSLDQLDVCLTLLTDLVQRLPGVRSDPGVHQIEVQGVQDILEEKQKGPS